MARGRREELFGPWELYRKIGLIFVTVFAVVTYIFLSFPLGIVVTLWMIAASYIWKSVEVTNVSLGTYGADTIPYKIALFFMVYRARLRANFNPVTLGFGPPSPDQDHGYEPGFGPPARLSSYWCLLAALIFGGVDYFSNYIRFPFWGLKLPDVSLAVLSVLGFFVVFQTITATFRAQADKSSLIGVESAPAVMVNKVFSDIRFTKLSLHSFYWSTPLSIIVVIIWFTAKLDWFIPTMIIVGTTVVGQLVAASILMTRAYRASWRERIERRHFWEGALSFFKNNTPTYVAEMSVPTVEEWEQENMGRPPEEIEPYKPLVNIATFLFPPNAVFDNYVGNEDRINGPLGATASAIAPIGKQNAEGQEMVGTVGSQGFRIWWVEEEVSISDALDPEASPWLREFAIRALIIPTIASIRGLGWCLLISNSMMTKPSSKYQILEIKLKVPTGINLGSFLSAIPALQESLGAKWVRAHNETRSKAQSGQTVTLLISNRYDKSVNDRDMKYVNPPRLARQILDVSEWLYIFHVNGVSGHAGTPKLVRRKSTTNIVDQLIFDLPDGLSYDHSVAGRENTLSQTSGDNFMEISKGDDSIQRGSTKDNSEDLSPKFTIIAAKQHPLQRKFNFTEYSDQLLLPRQPGVAQLEWSPGVMANDQLAMDKWSGDLPHLLLAGASGMGKSNLMNTMILQLAHNNGPGELQFKFIEPKNELQSFENIDTCQSMVDSWTPDEQFMYNVAENLEEAVREMQSRYRAMRDHPKKPKKLEVARRIAQRETGDPSGAGHPLMFPYNVIIIEECATVFADAASKEEKMEQGRIIACAAELFRKARAAGMYVVTATQYPTNASIPSVMRNQQRRIGLGCQNRVASDVVIGQPGLEKINTPGLGMYKPKFDYRQFRGFFLEEGDPDEGEANDVMDMLQRIPQLEEATSSDQGPQRIIAPDISDSIFTRWEHDPKAQEMIRKVEEGRKTKDIKDEDIPG